MDPRRRRPAPTRFIGEADIALVKSRLSEGTADWALFEYRTADDAWCLREAGRVAEDGPVDDRIHTDTILFGVFRVPDGEPEGAEGGPRRRLTLAPSPAPLASFGYLGTLARVRVCACSCGYERSLWALGDGRACRGRSQQQLHPNPGGVDIPTEGVPGPHCQVRAPRCMGPTLPPHTPVWLWSRLLAWARVRATMSACVCVCVFARILIEPHVYLRLPPSLWCVVCGAPVRADCSVQRCTSSFGSRGTLT